MLRINRTTTLSLIGLAALGLTAFAQEAPQQTDPQQAPPPQQAPSPARREAMAARRQAVQKLTADFGAAVKNAGLSADDQQKAQTAIAELQPHAKGTPRDPHARRQAMRVVREMSANPALRPEDRDLLAKDLAAVAPNHAQRN
ncbi:MAG TPA: hypothetical protein VGL53_15180 [Bryobacteraceae bacterium]|jgi:ribosomal protein S15P/S13E